MSVQRIEVPASPEILAAWKDSLAVPPSDDPGLSLAELCQLTGIGENAMRRRIKAGLATGQYKAGMAYRPKVNGVQLRVPVYEIVKK